MSHGPTQREGCAKSVRHASALTRSRDPKWNRATFRSVRPFRGHRMMTSKLTVAHRGGSTRRGTERGRAGHRGELDHADTDADEGGCDDQQVVPTTASREEPEDECVMAEPREDEKRSLFKPDGEMLLSLLPSVLRWST